jgi:hypothetical protein
MNLYLLDYLTFLKLSMHSLPMKVFDGDFSGNSNRANPMYILSR